MNARENDSAKRNRLTVFLLKETVSTVDAACLLDKDGVFRKNLDDGMILLWTRSPDALPAWAEDFFRDKLEAEKEDLKVAHASALLLLRVVSPSFPHGRLMALSFGSGRHLLQSGAIENRFGLITTLNQIQPDKILAIKKKTITQNPRISNEQTAHVDNLMGFSLDFDTDLVNSVTGFGANVGFQSVFSGSKSLNFSTRTDIATIRLTLESVLETYASHAYKQGFDWVDRMYKCEDGETVEALNLQLVERLQTGGEGLLFSPPDFIDWQEVSALKTSKRKRDAGKPVLEIIDLIKELGANGDNADGLTFEDLKKNHVTAWADDGVRMIEKWPFKDCIYMDTELAEKSYVYDAGSWYEVNREFLNELEDGLDVYFPTYKNLPAWGDSEDEKAYNQKLAKDWDGLFLDRQLVNVPNTQNKIEICDVLTADKKLVHVKRYHSSASLGHLFNQGQVSGRLLVESRQFREWSRDKIPHGNSAVRSPVERSVFDNQFKAYHFTVLYAIAGRNSISDLPLFSKICLRAAAKSLTSMGYKVEIGFIPD